MVSSMTELVFFEGLGLRLISRREIVGLSFVFVIVGDLIMELSIGILFIFFG